MPDHVMRRRSTISGDNKSPPYSLPTRKSKIVKKWIKLGLTQEKKDGNKCLAVTAILELGTSIKNDDVDMKRRMLLAETAGVEGQSAVDNADSNANDKKENSRAAFPDIGLCDLLDLEFERDIEMFKESGSATVLLPKREYKDWSHEDRMWFHFVC